MEDMEYYLVLAGVFAVQLVCCRFLKKWWLKIVPTVIVAGLFAACYIAYAASDFTNWGYIILFALLLGPLGADVVAWLIWGVWRLIAKHTRRSREN